MKYNSFSHYREGGYAKKGGRRTKSVSGKISGRRSEA